VMCFPAAAAFLILSFMDGGVSDQWGTTDRSLRENCTITLARYTA
jgi:hypothetical protein